eukprot:1159388-Pelagomonas_calceolata.AAC.7
MQSKGWGNMEGGAAAGAAGQKRKAFSFYSLVGVHVTLGGPALQNRSPFPAMAMCRMPTFLNPSVTATLNCDSGWGVWTLLSISVCKGSFTSLPLVCCHWSPRPIT